MLEYGGLSDDFGTVLTFAVDLMSELGDIERLVDLMELVDAHPRIRPPVAVRYAYHRARALLGSQTDADPDQVEADFRAAFADARVWRADPWAARVGAELGAWLSGRGREQEAVEPLRVAREGCSALGAARWSDQLEWALSGMLT
jgi:hypothetical protein